MNKYGSVILCKNYFSKLRFDFRMDYIIQLKYGYEGYRQFSIAPSPGLFPEAEPREINLGEG